MSDCFRELLDRKDAVDISKFSGPDDPIEKSDTVVGEMSEAAKRLWCLSEEICSAINADIDAGIWNLEARQHLEQKHEAVEALLWAQIHEDFPAYHDARSCYSARLEGGDQEL